MSTKTKIGTLITGYCFSFYKLFHNAIISLVIFDHLLQHLVFNPSLYSISN